MDSSNFHIEALLAWATRLGYFIRCVTTNGSVGCDHPFEHSH